LSNGLDNHNKKIFQVLRNDFNAVIADVTSQAEASPLFAKAFERYEQLLAPYLVIYQHHQGQLIDLSDLRERFIAETAILHVITQYLISLLTVKRCITVSTWPIHQSENQFAWYQIPFDLSTNDEGMFADTEITADLGIDLADFCDLLLSEFGARYLGEYYTPPALSKHLIDLACFHPSHLIGGATLVDPACGSGNILSVVLIQTLIYIQENASTAGFEAVRQNLFGFDIQPFAVTMTQTILQYIAFVFLDKKDIKSLELPLFPNIKCLDSLAMYETFWNHENDGFNFIVGNPPFMSVKKEPIPFIAGYTSIIKGHPNLYSMFLWWAVKSAAQGAYISFLLPQSILVGPYFSAIRDHLEQYTRIRAISRLINRTGVVGDADQQMMVISLEVGAANEQIDRIALRVTRNGDTLDHTQPAMLPYSTVSHRVNGEILWQVSDSLIDFEILGRIQSVCTEISMLHTFFKIGTGNFVWNEHKDLIRESEEDTTIPLLSAASISLYGFEFPYKGKHDTRTRQFALIDSSVSRRTHSGEVLLIKRTTPTKVGRRLIAGVPPASFFEQYPRYYLENHVNYIRVTNKQDAALLYGMLGWLNSDLINFVFQLRNGSTQVSVFELELLPVNLEFLRTIANSARRITQLETCTKRDKIIAQLNKDIFDWLGLEEHHRQRIQTMLRMKEK
jgi:hypothetical protein